MPEFINRMATQRCLLAIVNAHPWVEELFGLSRSSIDRWAAANKLRADSVEVGTLLKASEALSFLAMGSQDSVAPEYTRAHTDIESWTRRLEAHLATLALEPD